MVSQVCKCELKASETPPFHQKLACASMNDRICSVVLSISWACSTFQSLKSEFSHLLHHLLLVRSTLKIEDTSLVPLVRRMDICILLKVESTIPHSVIFLQQTKLVLSQSSNKPGSLLRYQDSIFLLDGLIPGSVIFFSDELSILFFAEI